MQSIAWKWKSPNLETDIDKQWGEMFLFAEQIESQMPTWNLCVYAEYYSVSTVL